MSSSLLSALESAPSDHLITHLRKNAKNEIRKIVTVDPATTEPTRKSKILQSFANKKIAAIVRADLEKNYGEEIARSILDDEKYQEVVLHGLTVMQGRALYAQAALALLPTSRQPII